MIKILPVFILGFAIILHSCKNRSDSEQLVQISEGFVNSNQLVKENIRRISNGLAQKSNEPQTSTAAETWYPPARLAERLADELTQDIDTLANRVQTGQAHIEDSLRDLFIKLDQYRSYLSRLFYPEIIKNQYWKKDIEDLNRDIPVLQKYPHDNSPQNKAASQNNWLKANFGALNPQMVKVMLSKIQNDVLISAYQLMEFCDIHVMSTSFLIDMPHPIAVLSSSLVKVGQPIDVTAGVGSYSRYLRPEIIINGDSAKLNDDGVAVVSVKAARKKGEHTIPVRISYWRADGMRAIYEKPLKYTSVE